MIIRKHFHPQNSYFLLLALCFFLFCLSSRLSLDGYELENVLSAMSIFHGNGPSLEKGFSTLPGVDDTIGDTPVYPRQNYLQPFISLPFYAVGAWLFKEKPTIPGRGSYWDLPWGPVLMVSLVNPLLATFTVLLVILLCLEFQLTRFQSQKIAILFACCSMAWPYSGLGMETLQTFLLTALIYTSIRFKHHQQIRYFILTAFLILLLPSCKKYSFIFLAPAMGYLTIIAFQQTKRWRISILLINFLSLSMGLTLVGISIFHRFKSNPQYLNHLLEKIFSQGVPSVDIIYGLTISPNEGLFVFNPILLFAFSGLTLFYEKHRGEFWYFLAILIVLLAALWRIPYLLIDEEWGPRYLHCLLPIFFVWGSAGLLKKRKGLLKILFIAVIILSLYIQTLGVLYLGFKILDSAVNLGVPDYNVIIFTPSMSQIYLAHQIFKSNLNRYFHGESHNLTHLITHSFSGRGGKQTLLSMNLAGYDSPAGAFFTIRWVLGSIGYHVWSEQITLVLFFTILLSLLGLLFFLYYREPRSESADASVNDASVL